jgi:hypothetical protein
MTKSAFERTASFLAIVPIIVLVLVLVLDF